jgi:vacuolar-type H+-ATPase subunit E/Vma4
MALELLLDSLARDVEGEARASLDAARVEAARIRADADVRAARRCAEALAARDTELRVHIDSARARARREARIATLRARDAFLERTFAAAEAELPGALDAPAYAAALPGLIAEALAFFPGVPAIVRCRTGLASRVSVPTESLGAIRLAMDDSVPEGVIVEAEDGSATVNNTLVERLRRRRPVLSIELLARLREAP